MYRSINLGVMAKAILTAEAIYTYIASDKDEISFEVGDTITIRTIGTGDWWYGEVKGKRGCLPKKYIKCEILGQCEVVTDYFDVQKDEMRLSVGDTIDIFVKDKEKWFGRNGNKDGWFASTFVKEIVKIDPKSKNEVFDEVTQTTGVLVDLRKDRPKKPRSKPPSRSSMDLLGGDAYDLLSLEAELNNMDETKHVEVVQEIKKDELIKPVRVAKISESAAPWLKELKLKQTSEEIAARISGDMKLRNAGSISDIRDKFEKKTPESTTETKEMTISSSSKFQSSEFREVSSVRKTSFKDQINGHQDIKIASRVKTFSMTEKELEKRVTNLEELLESCLNQIGELTNEISRLKQKS